MVSVALWYVSIHWASIPLVKLMVVSTSHAVLCPWGAGWVGGWELLQLRTADKPAGLHKVQVWTPHQITPPQARAQNYLPCSKISRRTEPENINQNVINHLFLQIIFRTSVTTVISFSMSSVIQQSQAFRIITSFGQSDSTVSTVFIVSPVVYDTKFYTVHALQTSLFDCEIT